jgi:hypothetical protein
LYSDFTEPSRKSAKKAYASILSEQVEVDLTPIKIGDLDNITINPAEMTALAPAIVE